MKETQDQHVRGSTHRAGDPPYIGPALESLTQTTPHKSGHWVVFAPITRQSPTGKGHWSQ